MSIRGKTRPGGRPARSTGGLKALLTSGALAAILWLWVMFAAPEPPAEEAAEAAPEPPVSPSIALQLEPLPTLVPAPDLSRKGVAASSGAPTRRGKSPAPALRSVQAPPPPAPRVVQVPAPSSAKPAAVTRSSR